jgi:hypothetical protein
MYPQRELNRLAGHKVILRRNIALRREQCAEAAARLAQPMQWADRMLALWRRVAPFARLAAVPLGLFAAGKVMPKFKLLGSLLRWGPLVVGAVRGFKSMAATARAGAR